MPKDVIVEDRFVIGIDPSGNWNKTEKGGTGLVLLGSINGHEVEWELTNINVTYGSTIWAKNYDSKEKYYEAIIDWIKWCMNFFNLDKNKLVIVIEDFRLQSGKAAKLSFQQMQTPELIGFLESSIESLGITHERQQNVVKSRWPKELLDKEFRHFAGKDVPKISRHEIDALRHALNYWIFGGIKIITFRKESNGN